MQGVSPESQLGAVPSVCQRDGPAAKGQLKDERGMNPFLSTSQSRGHCQAKAGRQQKAQLCVPLLAQ